MTNMKLTNKEVMACKDLFTRIAAEPALLDRLLKDLGKDPAEVRAQLNQGVDAFYCLYGAEVNIDTVKAKMDEATASMSPLQKYNYYANLMTAFSHLGAKVFGDASWTKCLNDHRNILSAIELGLIEEDDLHVADGIAQMQQIVAENIEGFAVLFVDDPDMAALLDACMGQDTATVKTMALNTRELAVDMAAAVYVMQEGGELKSLGQTHYTAYDIAVLSAAGLEIDAARKTGNLETVKKVLRKAAVVALALVLTAPLAIGAGFVAGAFVDMLVVGMFDAVMYLDLLGKITLVEMLIGGVAMTVFGIPVFDMAQDTLNVLLDKGAKVLDTAVEAVKPLFAKASAWVRNTVIPAAIPVWEKCRNFTYRKILVPSVAFILKHRKTILQTAGQIIQKAKALYEKLTNKATEVYQQGTEVVNNIVTAAQNLAGEETGNDVGAGTAVNVEPPVEYEAPIEEEENVEQTPANTIEALLDF